MTDDEPAISLRVHKVGRENEIIAFSLTIRNDTERALAAGIEVHVYGKRGMHGAERLRFSVTTPLPLEPGESHHHSSSSGMLKEELDMEFVARLAD
ncbi:MAG: hypothetical protein ACI9KE_001392 [Polyangiales bacterium]|jgi:hypothetical protein